MARGAPRSMPLRSVPRHRRGSFQVVAPAAPPSRALMPEQHEQLVMRSFMPRVSSAPSLSALDASPVRTPPAIHIKAAREGSDCLHEKAMLDLFKHPHIIECHGVSENGKKLMLEAGTHDLYHHIEKTANLELSSDEVLRIGQCIAGALAVMHNQGFSHNDVKAENIVMCGVDYHDNVIAKLIDFEFVTNLTAEPDQIAGTPAYNSPEKEENHSVRDTKADDMWALGVTLHLATFGYYPNGTSEPFPILDSDYRPPKSMNQDLATVLSGLLTVDPAKRWTAQRMLSFIGGGLASAPSPLKSLRNVSCPELQSLRELCVSLETDADQLPHWTTSHLGLHGSMPVHSKSTTASAMSNSPLPSPLEKLASGLHLNKGPPPSPESMNQL